MAAARRTPGQVFARVARGFAWVVLGPILVGAIFVAVALFYARSDGGRERLRRLALEEGRKAVPGLELGRIEGDYLHDLRLVNVTVRDREGREAVHADEVFARFDLWALARHTIAIDELRVEGARVLARPGSDGKLNLTELTAPPTPGPAGPPPAKAPWHVHVDRLAVKAAADFDLPDGPRLAVRELRLAASALVDGDATRVRVDRVSLDLGDAGRLSAAGTVALAMTAAGSMTVTDYDVALDAAALDPEAARLGPAGSLGFSVTARGHGLPLDPHSPDSSAVATLDLARSELGGLTLASGALAGRTTGTRWVLTRAAASAAGVEVVAEGGGHGAQLDVTVTAKLDGRVPTGASRTDVRGHGTVTAHVTGTPDALEVDAHGDVTAVRVGTLALGAASLRAHVTGPPEAPRGSVRLTARRVVVPGAPRIDTATLTAALDAAGLRVDAAVSGPRVRGGLRAHGVATAARADVNVDAFSIDFATARYRQVLKLQRPTRVRFEAGRSLTLDKTAVRGAGYAFTGDAVAAATLRLPAAGLPRGELALTLTRASLQGQPPIDADLRLRHLEERRADVKLTADLPAGGGQLTLDASVPLVEPRRGPPRLARAGAVQVHLDAKCVRLQELPLVDKALARQGVTGGVAHLALDVTGDVAHPDARGQFDLRDVTYRNIRGLGRDSTLKTVPGLGGSLTLDTSPGATHVGGTVLIRGAGVFKVDGRLAVDLGQLLAGADPRQTPVRATVDVPTFELGSLADFVDELHGLAGQLTAHAVVTGTLARPSGVADVGVANGKADDVTFRKIALHAAGDAGRVEATLEVDEAIGGTLTGSARLDRAAGDRVQASLAARDLDLRFVRVFVPTLRETAGVAQLSAKVAGTLAAPLLSASLDIEKGRLGVIGQPTFRDVRVQATLVPGRAELKRLDLKSGDGSLTGSGWATLDGWSPRRAVLTAHAHRFLVAAAGSTGARLDGELAVEVALQKDVLGGQVKVPSALVWLPKTPSGKGRDLQKIGPRDDVRFIDETARAAEERRQAAAKDSAGREARRPLVVDVHVRTGPIYVRSKDLDLELASTLQVGRVASGARAGAPTLSGGVHLRRGHINIQGQRFDIDPGDITFDGGPDLEPALSIRLERQYPDARIVVALEGTPKKPILRMTSEPPIYDQAQIVSLILTGQPGGQPSSGKAFDPTAAVATAVLGRLADEIAPQLGLDVLRVESVKQLNDEGYATGDSDTRVEVGKYISDRVYLSYAHVFAAPQDANQNEAHVEYRLTRRWMLESVFGDAGMGGVDALWTYRY